ncbi:hypothetical protein [Candidatus Marinarcus aquaticus]|uniref:Uncharacterized protein n=1 Tax=Candidatus Marinarcus aquaticus TaxID=2044504 RepID=A0A4Q0XT03_9BACT|nr:hypothetical protein [Candidatus Marinarcus aquaticus]RXJ60213.1 hypothetical protein CRV04_04205 [Candidatus Marinarcus aquaticus]
MITQINKALLFSTFNVDNFHALEDVMASMAPSMVEYYLSDLCCDTQDVYLNKREIENSISIGEYSIYMDYNEDIYLEMDSSSCEFETGSLW